MTFATPGVRSSRNRDAIHPRAASGSSRIRFIAAAAGVPIHADSPVPAERHPPDLFEIGRSARRLSIVVGENESAVLSGLSKPHDVAVDEVAGRLYWTEDISDSQDPARGAIGTSGLDGSNPSTFLAPVNSVVRDLTLVQTNWLVFEDGFETGDTTRWN